MEQSFSFINFQVTDMVAIVSLQNPPKKNAVNDQMLHEINYVLDIVERDKDIRALIFWGDETLFGAGADISHSDSPIKTAYDSYLFSRHLQTTFSRVQKISKPAIAAMAGYVLGAGLELSLACDLRIASANVRIGLPEVSLGSLPGAGGTQRLPRLVGVAKAKEIMFFGEYLGAAEALQIGLVNRIVEANTLMDETMKWAKKLAKQAPLSLAKIKDAVDNGVTLGMDLALEYEAKCFSTLFGTSDREEGLRAFSEKRTPTFKGE